MEVSKIAETVGVVTSITMCVMSASLQRSMMASAEVSTILTLGGKRCKKVHERRHRSSTLQQ